MRSLLLACLFLLLITLNSLTYAQSADADPQYMYVCNQGSATVSVLDASVHEVAETIDLQKLGFSANAKPHYAIAEPDGSFWYVTLIGENTVLKFNRKNELVGQAELEVPGLMALHPGKDELYVARSMSAVNPPQSFGIIRRSDMEVLNETSLFFTRPHAIAALSGQNRVFVGSLSSNQFLSVDTESEASELIRLEGMNHVFVNFAISPDGKTMVATGQVTGKLLVFDITDPASPELTKAINVNAQPWHPVFSPDGSYLYFANKEANSVTVVDMESRKVDAVIKGKGLAQPHGAALTADGKFLYVTNNNLNAQYLPEGADQENPPGTVVIIDTKSREIVKVIEVGQNTTGIGTSSH